MLTRVYNPYEESGNRQIYKSSQTTTSSLLRGTVVSNNDPLNLGRLKVRVDSVHQGIKDEDLPWCMPNSSSASANSGTFIIPEENNAVWVAFEDGDIYRPVWLGCAYSAKTTRSKQIGNTMGQKRARVVGRTESPTEGWSLEHKVIYKAPSGSIIYMDETENGDSIVLRDNGGTLLRIGSGFVRFTTAGGIDFILEDAGDYVEFGVGGTLIRLDCKDKKITITNQDATILLDKEKIETKYKNSKFVVEEKKIEGVVDKTKFRIGNGGFEVSDEVNSVISDGNVTVKSDGATIELGEGVANIKAETVNIDASFVNIPRGD